MSVIVKITCLLIASCWLVSCRDGKHVDTVEKYMSVANDPSGPMAIRKTFDTFQMTVLYRPAEYLQLQYGDMGGGTGKDYDGATYFTVVAEPRKDSTISMPILVASDSTIGDLKRRFSLFNSSGDTLFPIAVISEAMVSNEHSLAYLVVFPQIEPEELRKYTFQVHEIGLNLGVQKFRLNRIKPVHLNNK